MNNLLCIYHKSCMDGFGAAYAVWKKFPDAEFVAAHYGDVPPDVTDRDVVIVDFSYKREIIEELAEKAKSVIVLDHHKTAIEDLAGFEHPKLTLVLDDTRSGAVITWEHFHTEPVPQLLLHIQDRDLWKFELPDTRALHAYMISEDFAFQSFDYLKRLVESGNAHAEVGQGKALLKHQTKQVESICANTSKVILSGYEVEMVNCPGWLASEVGNELAKRNKFSLSYFDIPGKRVFSLRSVGDFDVSAIAKDHGGGGHRNAAGFTIALENAALVPSRCQDTAGIWINQWEGSPPRAYILDVASKEELFTVGNDKEAHELACEIVFSHNKTVRTFRT